MTTWPQVPPLTGERLPYSPDVALNQAAALVRAALPRPTEGQRTMAEALAMQPSPERALHTALAHLCLCIEALEETVTTHTNCIDTIDALDEALRKLESMERLDRDLPADCRWRPDLEPELEP